MKLERKYSHAIPPSAQHFFASEVRDNLYVSAEQYLNYARAARLQRIADKPRAHLEHERLFLPSRPLPSLSRRDDTTRQTASGY